MVRRIVAPATGNAGRNRRTEAPIPAPTVAPCRHTDAMDEASFMVRGRTRDICQRELDRICTLPGIHAVSTPSDVTPPGWIARAVLRPAVDAEPRT